MKIGRGERVVPAVLALLGIGLLLGRSAIGMGAGYDRIGPRFFPTAVGLGLVFVGAGLVAATLRRRGAGEPDGTTPAADLRGLSAVALALLCGLLLLEPAGFVLGSSVLFWLTARGFGSRRPALDAAIAIGLSALIYLAFTRGLGLSLPAGFIGVWI